MGKSIALAILSYANKLLAHGMGFETAKHPPKGRRGRIHSLARHRPRPLAIGLWLFASGFFFSGVFGFTFLPFDFQIVVPS